MLKFLIVCNCIAIGFCSFTAMVMFSLGNTNLSLASVILAAFNIWCLTMNLKALKGE